jgi:RND family efflux transporter MFP subunit
LLKIHVRAGDRVPAGAVVAELESAELLALQTEWLSVHVAMRLAEETVKTLEASGGAIAGQSLLDARTQLAQAKNASAVARAKWLASGLPAETLEHLLTAGSSALSANLPIRAPLSGVVTSVGATVGQMVESGRTILIITDLSKVWVKVSVLESDLDRVAAGQPCELRFAALPGESVAATIRHIGLALDPETQMAAAWVELDNPSNSTPKFVPGMFGEARISGNAAAKTRSIPTTALIDNGVDRFVFVVGATTKNADEFLRRSVEVVRTTPTLTEIRSADLFPGDRVVTRGSHQLGSFFAPAVLQLSPPMIRSLGLQFAPVRPQIIADVLEVPARIDVPPDRRGAATSAGPGTLESILVQRDETVKTGQIVATVFSSEFLAAQLDLLKERLAGNLAQQQLSDARNAGTGVPRKRLIDLEATVAENKLRRADLRRRLAIWGLTEQQLDALEKDQRMTPILPIRAAQSGAAVHFESMIGRAVRADEPIIAIHDVGQAWVRGALAEADWRQVTPGQSVRVRLMNRWHEPLSGRVVRTTPAVSGERTAFLWAELDQLPEPLPRHDQLAHMTIEMNIHAPVLAVPVDAVVRDAGVDYVFVQLADHTIERRAVELGRRDDQWVEIRSGIAADTPIAVTAVQALQTAYASVK